MQGLVKFIIGGAAGTAVGLVVGSLLAPQKGEELQAETRLRVQAARDAGETAERETAAAMRERFRQKVNDPNAFTGATSLPNGPRS